MLYKHENGNVIEIHDKNLMSLLEREGFVEMTKKEAAAYKKIAEPTENTGE